MYCFNSDYTEGCHPQLLEALTVSNMEQTVGYGEDEYCKKAAEAIKCACQNQDVYVQFLVGGTQTNLTVISAALRSHQGVLSACSGHIGVHETGAIEATGHKVLPIASKDGKISAQQVLDAVEGHYNDATHEHMVQPKMVYISNPTELGTIYCKEELEQLRKVCDEKGLYLFMDGARLGYGLMCPENDLTLNDLCRLCDVFYIGGTKVGALFGEAVVIRHPGLKEDFRYIMKQHGALLAKGRLLGVQFLTLFQDDLYFKISEHAICMAKRLREGMKQLGVEFLVDSPTNQMFPIFPDELLKRLDEKYVYSYQERVDEGHSAIRFCTSWATKEEAVEELLKDIKEYMKNGQ